MLCLKKHRHALRRCNGRPLPLQTAAPPTLLAPMRPVSFWLMGQMAPTPARLLSSFASTFHVPATRPSTRKVARTCRFLVTMRPRCSSAMKRLRSAWASTRLSNSGRKRIGAGVSWAGRGASGKSNNSFLFSSRKVTSSGLISSNTARSPCRPDQVCASVGVAGPNAAR